MDDAVACLCCGYLTLSERYGWEICPVCIWEDDIVQGEDPNFAGGANTMSLKQARINFRELGACDRSVLKYVRAPLPEEIPN